MIKNRSQKERNQRKRQVGMLLKRSVKRWRRRLKRGIEIGGVKVELQSVEGLGPSKFSSKEIAAALRRVKARMHSAKA